MKDATRSPRAAGAPRSTGVDEVERLKINEARLASLEMRADRLVTKMERLVEAILAKEGANSDPEAEPVDVIRTRRVEVVDAQGRTRVSVGCIDGGALESLSPGVAVFDEQGERRAFFTVDSEGLPGLYLDQGGQIVASVTAERDDGGHFLASGPAGLAGVDSRGLLFGYELGPRGRRAIR